MRALALLALLAAGTACTPYTPERDKPTCGVLSVFNATSRALVEVYVNGVDELWEPEEVEPDEWVCFYWIPAGPVGVVTRDTAGVYRALPLDHCDAGETLHLELRDL